MWRCLLPLLVLITACTDPDPSALAIEMAEALCDTVQVQRTGVLPTKTQPQLMELRSRLESFQRKAERLRGDAGSVYNRTTECGQAGILKMRLDEAILVSLPIVFYWLGRWVKKRLRKAS